MPYPHQQRVGERNQLYQKENSFVRTQHDLRSVVHGAPIADQEAAEIHFPLERRLSVRAVCSILSKAISRLLTGSIPPVSSKAS